MNGHIYIRIHGGYGRVLASSGAVAEFARNHSCSIVTGYPSALQGIPGVERIYPHNAPFLYRDKIKDGIFLSPEPYLDYRFYREKHHLSAVFNSLLNNDDNFIPTILNLNDNEKMKAENLVNQSRKEHGKKIVVIQPWGSTGGKFTAGGKIMPDVTYRSMGIVFAMLLAQELYSNGYQLWVVRSRDQIGLGTADEKYFDGMETREIMAVLPYVDGIISCNSFLYHASAALGTPAPTVVLWASTHIKNFGYKEHINMISPLIKEEEPFGFPHEQDYAYYFEKNKGCDEFPENWIFKILASLNSKNRSFEKIALEAV